MKLTQDALWELIAEMGWDISADEIDIEVGGCATYEIEGAGTKWAPHKGTKKFNKDAFIIIKNQSRR